MNGKHHTLRWHSLLQYDGLPSGLHLPLQRERHALCVASMPHPGFAQK